MTVVSAVAGGMLLVAAALMVLRVIMPGTIPDRVVALDAGLAVVSNGLAVMAVGLDDSLPAELVLMLSMLGFLSSTAAAAFVRARGA